MFDSSQIKKVTATGCAILIQVAQGGAVARKVNVYTRHIRNTKGQRSG